MFIFPKVVSLLKSPNKPLTLGLERTTENLRGGKGISSAMV